MKSLSDLLQILLSLPGWVGYVACFIMVAFFLQAVRILRFAWSGLALLISLLRKVAVKPSPGWILWVALLALPLWAFRQSTSDGLQWVEQRYLNPLFFTPDTSNHMLAIYEMEMALYCDPYECEIIRTRTRQIAEKVGSTPLGIYEVAFSECGMNPFIVRTDGVAAGWIQFTRAGLIGTGFTLEQVKEACRQRNTALIMDLTEIYLVNRSKGKPMPRSCDVYTCVFAPGYLGFGDDQMLYGISDGAAYYLNAGLDGYYLQQVGDQQIIMHSRKAADGRITINDLALALAAKKAALAKKYENLKHESIQ